jgi:outer membrane protein TolC
VGVDLGLARNLLLPALDLGTAFYQDMGAHVTSRGPTQLTAGVNFEMPVQRRQAKGLEAAALARIEQVDQRERFARDQVTAEVRDAHSAVTQAFRQAQVLHEQVGIAHQLEDAERVRFDLGEGTLFLINLREQVTFDTALREIGAVNEYYRALALYEFAIAEGLNRRPAVRH